MGGGMGNAVDGVEVYGNADGRDFARDARIDADGNRADDDDDDGDDDDTVFGGEDSATFMF